MANARVLTRQMTVVHQRLTRTEQLLSLAMGEIQFLRGELRRINMQEPHFTDLDGDPLESLGYPLDQFPKGDPSDLSSNPLSSYPLPDIKGGFENSSSPYPPEILG